MSLIRTRVKTLTGDIFTVEHHPGALEYGLKDAINNYCPKFYSECQNIVYENNNKKDECYLILDTVNDVIQVELETDVHEMIILNNKDIRGNHYEESTKYNTITAKLVNIRWFNKVKNDGKRGGVDFIFHPYYGFTSMELMIFPYRDDYVVPNLIKYKQIWFSTFQELMLFLTENEIRKFPRIFSSEDFLIKIQEECANL